MRRSAIVGLALIVAVVSAMAIAGCCAQTARTVPASADPLLAPRAETAPRPAAPDLSTPAAAVRTYLQYVTAAYATGDSDLASPAVDPYELVRVDSYIELNRQGSKRLLQDLVSLKIRSESAEGTQTLIAATEDWRYRYFSTSDGTWIGPVRTITYETTYTLAPPPSGTPVKGAWVVTKVEARPLGTVY